MKLEIETVVSPRLANLYNINLNDEIQRALIQASMKVTNTAKDLAPYLSGALKSSIGTDMTHLSQLYTVVGSRLSYARIRHEFNRKNPQTLRYLFRGYQNNEKLIQDIFKGVINKVFIK